MGNRFRVYGILFLWLGMITSARSQNESPISYKQIGETILTMDVCYPSHFSENKQYPTLVLFHGGGWKQGDPNDLGKVANYFTQKGYLAFLVSYRLRNGDQTTVEDAVKDTKSALRFLKKNNKALGINPNKIAVIGISAGGHLAACSAAANLVNESSDDLNISATPNAIVLYSPILDLGPGKYGYGAIEKQYTILSPLHLIKEKLPPTLLINGTKDRYLSVETTQLYQNKMQELGNICKVYFIQDAEHGLLREDQPEQVQTILLQTQQFLEEHL